MVSLNHVSEIETLLSTQVLIIYARDYLVCCKLSQHPFLTPICLAKVFLKQQHNTLQTEAQP